jgi:hypothetical protein
MRNKARVQNRSGIHIIVDVFTVVDVVDAVDVVAVVFVFIDHVVDDVVKTLTLSDNKNKT